MNVENRTLIAYTTKSGATEKTARQIAQVLRSKYSLQVDEVNLAKQQAPSIAPYRNVIVASGVRKGAVYDETLQFLSRDFSGKRVAYFTCSGFIYPKTYEETVALYIKGVLASYPRLHPVATAAFGGYLKVLGVSVARKMDPAKVEAWAEQLGQAFSAVSP